MTAYNLGWKATRQIRHWKQTDYTDVRCKVLKSDLELFKNYLAAKQSTGQREIERFIKECGQKTINL